MWTVIKLFFKALDPRLLIAALTVTLVVASYAFTYMAGEVAKQREWDAANTTQELETAKLVLAAKEKEKALTAKVNNVAVNYEKAKQVNTALVSGLTGSVRELQAELDKRDAASAATPTVNHGPTPERLVCRSALENLGSLAQIADEHREQIIALQAYITSVQNPDSYK